MPTPDPFAALTDWRISLYRGAPEEIERFLERIDASLPSGWTRDRSYEAARAQPDHIRCFLFDQPADAVVRVWLQRVTNTRVRGGAVQVLRCPDAVGTRRIAELVESFADQCVLPAARMARLVCTRPKFGVLSALTSSIAMLFTRLADSANGEWPLTATRLDLWDDLILSCLSEHVAIDRGELQQWLKDSGWSAPHTAAIVEQFFHDSDLFARQQALIAR